MNDEARKDHQLGANQAAVMTQRERKNMELMRQLFDEILKNVNVQELIEYLEAPLRKMVTQDGLSLNQALNKMLDSTITLGELRSLCSTLKKRGERRVIEQLKATIYAGNEANEISPNKIKLNRLEVIKFLKHRVPQAKTLLDHSNHQS